ncbi:MAG: hypothetical protein M3071_24880 [Actinomycetota bacterium]|nr:hypothetical protein [Actinomycetota bacterium]
MYVHGYGQSPTMCSPVVLTASTGVRRLSAIGWAATAEFDKVGPSWATTLLR